MSELASRLADGGILLKIDGGTGNQVVEGSCDGTVMFEAYAVAVVTTMMSVFDKKPT